MPVQTRPQRPPSSLPPREGPVRRCHLGPRKGTLGSQHITSPGILGLDLPASSTVTNKIPLVVSSSVCGISLRQPERATATSGRSPGRKPGEGVPGGEGGEGEDVGWAEARPCLRGRVCARWQLGETGGKKERRCWKRLALDREVLIWHPNALSCR